jgi:hypothetical protein
MTVMYWVWAIAATTSPPSHFVMSNCSKQSSDRCSIFYKTPETPCLSIAFHPISQNLTRSQPLPEPLAQFRLAKLVQLQETFFAQINALHVGRVLRRWAGDSAGDDYRVGLEDDAVVDDLVDGEGGQVVVLDEGALVDGVPVARTVSGNARACRGDGRDCLLQEDVQAVPQREHDVIQHDLVLVCGTNDVKHHVTLGLVDDDPVVIEDHIVG